jgi:hypothetical protein
VVEFLAQQLQHVAHAAFPAGGEPPHHRPADADCGGERDVAAAPHSPVEQQRHAVANDFSGAGQHVGCRVVGVRPGLTAAQVPHIATDVDALVVDDSAGTPKLFASVNAAMTAH